MGINPHHAHNLTHAEFCRLADNTDPIMKNAIDRIEELSDENKRMGDAITHVDSELDSIGNATMVMRESLGEWI